MNKECSVFDLYYAPLYIRYATVNKVLHIDLESIYTNDPVNQTKAGALIVDSSLLILSA